MKILLKNSLVASVACVAFATGLSAKIVGSGNVVTETRNASGFHSIELVSSGDVVITQGDTEGVVIEAEDNLLPVIETKVTEGGVLQLGFKTREELHYTKRLLFKVSARTVDTLVLAGSGNVGSKALKADKLRVKLAGSGNINVGDLTVDTLTVEIVGSGDVKLAGKAARQTVEVVGSGDYSAGDLQTGAATVNMVGSGDCEVAASEMLDVNVSGSGDVSYHGNPKLTKHVSGSGAVESLGAGK